MNQLYIIRESAFDAYRSNDRKVAVLSAFLNDIYQLNGSLKQFAQYLELLINYYISLLLYLAINKVITRILWRWQQLCKHIVSQLFRE